EIEGKAPVNPLCCAMVYQRSVAMRWLVVLPVAVFLLAWWGYVQALPYAQPPYDDSCIAQQYARHLFSTGMFTFDGETPSRGATSPPHVILLALARSVISDPVIAARLIGLVCHGGFLVLLFLLIRDLGCRSSVAVVVVSAAASCGFLVVDSLNGLETSLFHFLSTALILIALRARDTKGLLLLAVVAWLVCWCRPEGFLLVAVFLPFFLWRLKSRPLPARIHPLIIAALFLGPFLVGMGYFLREGTPSWQVKMIFYGEAGLPLGEKTRLAWHGVGAFAYFLRWYLVIPFAALCLRFASRWTPRLSCQSPGCFVAGTGSPTWLSRSVLSFVLVFYSVYLWCLPSALFYLDFRYQHVLLPWVFVAVAWGFEGLVSRMRSITMRRVAFSLLTLTLLLGSIMTYRGCRTVYMDCVRSVGNVLIPLAERLGRMAMPGDVVAAHDVGVLGYFSGLRVVDLVGLTDPRVSAMLKRGDYVARDHILGAGHGFLVAHPVWDELYLGIDPDEPGSGFRFLFETELAFGDRYRVYRFGE
ncbi:MAG: hypothetical protein ABIH23_33305, partial [bacterium]